MLTADGLAAGKGVLILEDLAGAEAELKAMLDGKFGEASANVVIEEFLPGIEVSVFILTDGKSYLIFPEAKDYVETYDIDFTAPKFDASGNKTANARITVVHNGVKIHDNVELPKGTGAGGSRPEVAKGPILFQGHGNPTAYRNVWLVEK